ncbi:hypothetical protein EUZ85_15555 [Hahella sp. KA22]|uniref:hypothetical protein n=1 Tax=Hahella sp. KA22 TaxID=1628392 RepID=UPI000FDE0FFA|nr:hypothetical protein [Hahella sp. KA22]AZZ92064.1 hypothetical protein ENC22_12990 [Hahella sp. KA22]QAY55435.1 hypothetical protein EUZ85_15555 [Hahella sp. KA22]
MGRSLRSLEQSLARDARPERSDARGLKREDLRRGAGMSASPPGYREQIEVVRGQRVAQPTRSLRALEDRVLGRRPSAPAMTEKPPQRTMLRMDQEQAPSLPAPALEQPPFAPAAQSWSASQSYQPNYQTSYQTSYQASHQTGYPQPAAGSLAYAPEFSAPDTGRFRVEPFEEPQAVSQSRALSGPTSPDDLFRPDPAVASPAPSNTTPTYAPTSQPSLRTESPNGGQAAPPALVSRQEEEDDLNWLADSQPQRVTAASKQALDAGLALAKDDFERDLAAILGHSAPAASGAAEPPLASPAQPAPPQTPNMAGTPQSEDQAPARPTHDIFDQMGLAMRYANSFDLGAVPLKERFDQFERELQETPSQPPQPSAPPTVQSPFVDPMNLDEFDLVAELAEIGAERPSQAPIMETETDNKANRTEETAGDDNEQPTG